MTLIVATVLTGCAQQIAGTAQPKTAQAIQQPAYFEKLTEQERRDLSEDAQIRAVDPCGFVDQNSLETIGILRRFDAAESQQDCDIDIVVDRDSDRSLEVRVAVVPRGTTYEENATTEDIDGVQVMQSVEYPGRTGEPSVNQCRNLAPLDDKNMLLVSVLRRTNDPACDEANTIMAGMVPRLHDRPQRQGSKYQAYHAVSVADPCAALGVIGEDRKITMSDLMKSPWSCTFSLDGEEGLYTVSLESKSLDTFDKPYTGTSFELDGHPAVRNDLSASCSVEVAVGDPDDDVLYAPVRSSVDTTNTVRVSAPDCDEAESTASAAVAAFLG